MIPRKIGQPRFLSFDEVLSIHEISIERFGGTLGTRDPGLLDAALAMPRQSFGGTFAHDFPFEMAAAYAFHIAKNHPFVDGNKRTALAACATFLHLNGYTLPARGVESADKLLALIENALTKQDFATWTADRCVPRPEFELRDFLRELTGDAFQQWYADALNSGRAGMLASNLEAERVLPIIADLTAKATKYLAAQDEPAAHTALTQLGVFIALFRLAEDLGYEW